MLGTDLVFVLEGPEGNAELWEDEFGYKLFFEWVYRDKYCEAYKSRYSRPELYATYEFDDDAIADAFEDAKVAVGLEGWNMTLLDIELNTMIDDDEEWQEFRSAVYKATEGLNDG